jgi:hypothetical protein
MTPDARAYAGPQAEDYETTCDESYCEESVQQ